MIISRTPYRISFFGGGTDYPGWYAKEEGAVLSAAIDKYCYISCRYLPPFFNIRHRIVWSHIEMVNSISEILHPAVREGLRHLGFDDSQGLEIHHQGDLPARSGIGSSSTFSVGLIKALTALRGERLTKHDLALKAIELEQTVLKENVGSQDQVAAAHGGLNVIRFRCGGIEVSPLQASKERLQALEDNLLLLYTGTNRLGGEIAKQVIANLGDKASSLRQLRGMVDTAQSIVSGNGDLDAFGRLLHEAWMLKRGIAADISNETVDGIYETALRHGAIGGKLCGAGSKGFMLFYVPKDRQAEVMKSLSHYLWVPVAFDHEGSTTIYHDIP
jgi:D-glycero-alpha-D-manno-heptose-7-phosphate kinase